VRESRVGRKSSRSRYRAEERGVGRVRRGRGWGREYSIASPRKVLGDRRNSSLKRSLTLLIAPLLYVLFLC
jgi:hypothetical protein